MLDRILDGAPAEKVLTTWARGHRFAGSGDRAAIRDHVFDALRCLRSSAARGGAMTGRGVMIGLLHLQGIDPASLFDGVGHAPPPLSPSEVRPGPIDDPLDALDCPAWLASPLQQALGQTFAAVMAEMRQRAPVFVRVNLRKGAVGDAIQALGDDDIGAARHPLSPTALQITSNPRRLRQSQAFAKGLVEMQDASSQALVDSLPLENGMSILDFCAGGGGKSLAMAARVTGDVTAHDISAARMNDLPARAARAGVSIDCHTPQSLPDQARFDLVLVDAPCSGSGTWRRHPQSKWTLDDKGLSDLVDVQHAVLTQAEKHVAQDGILAYATCSLLTVENDAQVRAWCADTPGWRIEAERRWSPLQGGDGFYLAVLRRHTGPDPERTI